MFVAGMDLPPIPLIHGWSTTIMPGKGTGKQQLQPEKSNPSFCDLSLISLRDMFALQICVCEDRQWGFLQLLLPENLQWADLALLPPLLRRGPLLQRVLGGERPRDWLRGSWRQSFCLQLRKRLLRWGADFKILQIFGPRIHSGGWFFSRTLQTIGTSGKEGTGNTTQTSISRPADDVLHDMRGHKQSK